ncbi:MAG TPA: hypothetical protein VHF91_07330, partial [Acidimicrobiales bacterium]|nr:hypothetical protein [Acidimicrobiales bacterium]
GQLGAVGGPVGSVGLGVGAGDLALAFQSNRSGGTKIFVINLDGTALVQVAGGSGYGDFVPDWQRDPATGPSITTTTTAPPAPPTTVRRRR